MQESLAAAPDSASLLVKAAIRAAAAWRSATLPARGATARSTRRLAQASRLGRNCATSRSQPHLRSSMLHSVARKFFLAREQPLETAAMDRQTERVLQVRHQIAGAQIGTFPPPLLDMRQDLRCKLVPMLRPTPLGQQSGKPACFEGRVGLISRRQRDPKQLRRCGNRFVLDEMPPHHLVTNLQQVAGVEKAAGPEQRIGHCLGPAIERPGRLQSSDFGVRAAEPTRASCCQFLRSRLELCRWSWSNHQYFVVQKHIRPRMRQNYLKNGDIILFRCRRPWKLAAPDVPP